MSELTEDQRKEILFDLCSAISIFKGSGFPIEEIITKYGGALWIHFTDYSGTYDLRRLLDNEIIEFHPSLKYQPDNSWRDHFPPTAYRLTAKGRNIINFQSRWVFSGLFDEPEPPPTRIKKARYP